MPNAWPLVFTTLIVLIGLEKAIIPHRIQHSWRWGPFRVFPSMLAVVAYCSLGISLVSLGVKLETSMPLETRKPEAGCRHASMLRSATKQPKR